MKIIPFMIQPLRFSRLMWFGALFFAASASHAVQCSGISTGSSSTDDVKLGGIDSSQCVISAVNPQQGPNGNIDGFDEVFGNEWSLLNKAEANDGSMAGTATVGGVVFTVGFTEDAAGKSGTWSVMTDKASSFDLVFAMHAAKRSSAYLFDEASLFPNQMKSGIWEIEWLNGGEKVPTYSNVTLFVRGVVDQAAISAQAIPEPQTCLLVLGGLAGVALSTRRRQLLIATLRT